MKKSIRYLYIFVFLFSCSLAIALQGHAQGHFQELLQTVNSGEILIGVNILILDEGMGVATDDNGEYEITGIPEGNYQVEARYIGYNSQTEDITIGDGQELVLDFELVMSTSQLDELVVTSFGLEQERKALGYSVQEIDSENLTVGNQANVVNALSGKVSGVQITNTVELRDAVRGLSFAVSIRLILLPTTSPFLSLMESRLTTQPLNRQAHPAE